MSTIVVEQVEQQDPRLGRHLVHDARSRAFPANIGIDPATWRSRTLRVIDPRPNPNQPVGCCTMCAKAMQLNTVGNRKVGRVLGLGWALQTYEWETANDDIEGAYPPDDTGSSGLASCKTAVQFGVGGVYRWLFGGVDEVVQAVVNGESISVGTWWYDSMFYPDDSNTIHVSGRRVGGHQYLVRGYNKAIDRLLVRCWWGYDFRDVWIARGALGDLLADGGDAHHQRTT